MMHILGAISIYGAKASLDQLALASPILNSTLKQAGTLRKMPEADLWHYSSPWYAFCEDNLNDEVHNFLLAHKYLGDALALEGGKIKYATFTLCPVEQNYEEAFAFLFDLRTLKALVQTGLSLEMAPASTMPEAVYWMDVS